ncbi:hypothetical protein B0T10DRAFT_463475 [Thelonectria olida]|uniref:Uncharacterized protein n=1 Tax=Thelonectria olida TaxID=1576542 RepID=A0A9P9ALR2_9HYPO|nr:hypothetical protein B0T10DRAFT_463475 [Thelonectria olida]
MYRKTVTMAKTEVLVRTGKLGRSGNAPDLLVRGRTPHMARSFQEELNHADLLRGQYTRPECDSFPDHRQRPFSKTAVPQILSDYTQIAVEQSRTITNPLDTRRTIHSVISQLHHWGPLISPDWEYELIALKDSNEAVDTRSGNIRPYGVCYFIYNKAAAHVAASRLGYYISEILLGEVLLSSAQWEISENTEGTHAMSRINCWAVRRTMDLMAGCICASITWLLGSGPSATT